MIANQVCSWKTHCKFSCHSNGPNFELFSEICKREAGEICGHVNILQRRPIKELLGEKTERLSVLATLRVTRYRHLHKHIVLPLMREALGSVLYESQRTVHKIFCKTVPKDSDKIILQRNKVKYTISKTWGLTRGQLIERVTFLELLTYFYMEKYRERYEEGQEDYMGKQVRQEQFFGRMSIGEGICNISKHIK